MRDHCWRSLGLGLLSLALLSAGVAADDDIPKVRDKPAKGVAKNKKAEKLDAKALAARIDELIQAKWKENKVKPSTPASDAEFMRRVYLDLAGRVPRVSEVREFLADTDKDKRWKLIDELLKSSAYANHFANVWREMIIPQSDNQQVAFLAPQMEQWLSRRLRDNLGYDKMVRQLLTAPVTAGQPRQRVDPDEYDPSVFAFYQANEYKPENVAATTSRLFLGVKLECAQCHDHPFNDYSQRQFWEYTAFFAGIRPARQSGRTFQQAGEDPNITEIEIPGKNKKVKARFLDGGQPKFSKGVTPRETLADWMTAKDNPYFARSAVNRLWAHLYGIGLIDPVDEPSKDNPPSHSELLDELADQFVLNNYDLKYLIKAIVGSKTYQLSSQLTDVSQDDARLYGRMTVKGLSPEQLYNSIVLATGYKDPQRQYNRGFGQRQGMELEFRNRFANYADRRTEFQTSILQALSLMNGRFMADATSLSRSETLSAVIDSPFLDTKGKINALFMAAVAREMGPDEVKKLVKYVTEGGPSKDSDKALSDIFWALLNSSEFILNH